MMKSVKQYISLSAFLALVCLTAIVSSKDLSPSLGASTSVTKRRLEEEGFDIGEWAGNVWDGIFGRNDDAEADQEEESSWLDNFFGGNDDAGTGEESGASWLDNLFGGNDDAPAGEEESGGSLLDNLFGGDDNSGENNDQGFLDFDIDFCSFVEGIIGMGESFGLNANCECSGDWDSGVKLQCNFDECAPGSDVCGKVDLGYTFGGINGPITMDACADFENDEYKRTCVSYQLQTDNGFNQTCQATYGGRDCECSIENGICLKTDCSRFVPGASVDTCKFLSMSDASDTQNFFPDFDIFQNDFQLFAENVPWANLDFDNLDSANFDVADVQWENFLSTADETWTDLIGDNPTFRSVDGLSEGVCTLLYQAVSLSQDLGAESSCTCGYDEASSALKLSCDFEESCTGEDDPLCGSARVDLTYESLTKISADVCIRYLDFPETCYSYGIPFAEVAGSTEPSFFRDCSAQYGGENNKCKCTVDENSCLQVDCTEFEPLAITDQCQVVGFDEAAEDPSRVLLNFKTPTVNDVVSDGAGGVFVALESLKSSGSTHGIAFAVATVLVAVAGQVWA